MLTNRTGGRTAKNEGWRSQLEEWEKVEVTELEKLSAEYRDKRAAVTAQLNLIRNRCHARIKFKRKKAASERKP